MLKNCALSKTACKVLTVVLRFSRGWFCGLFSDAFQ
jgi:hypothetical protein